MHRDMKLIKQILGSIADSSDFDCTVSLDIHGYEQKTVKYHISLLKDHECLAFGDPTQQSSVYPFKVRLTWAGHDLLEKL